MTFLNRFKVPLVMGAITLFSGLVYASSEEWFNSVRSGNIGAVKELIQNTIDIDQVDQINNTALMMAALEGHLKIVEILIGAEADINLELAVIKKQEVVVKMLLERGALPLDQEKVASLACDQKKIIINNLDLYKKYTDKAGDWFKQVMPTTVIRNLMWRKLYGKKGAKMSLGIQLLNAIQDLQSGEVEENNLEKVERLLFEGASVNVVDYNGNTPLFIAIDSDNEKLVSFLLSSKADIFFTDKGDGSTALHKAVYAENEEIVKKLISKAGSLSKKDCFINMSGEDGKTSLIWAAE